MALILVNIVSSWDIEGLKLGRVCGYPNEGQYSPISMQYPFYYIAMNIVLSFCFLFCIFVYLTLQTVLSFSESDIIFALVQ